VANRRTYTDEELVIAVQKASCWADVRESLGKTRGGASSHVKTVAIRLGLDTSHFSYRRSSVPLLLKQDLFSRPIQRTSKIGLTVAATWFLERGYNVAVPMEVASYDLIVESDQGLKKVQVKTTTSQDTGGCYTVSINRQAYDATSPTIGSHGRVKRTPYLESEIDFFFIVTGDHSFYLIPVQQVLGLQVLSLGRKYKNFLV